MEKLKMIQKRNNLNEVFTVGGPGPGGAHHDYFIAPAPATDPSGSQKTILHVEFQRGPRNDETSRPGVLDVDLLEIVRDRLKAFQQGDFATRENAIALTHIGKLANGVFHLADGAFIDGRLYLSSEIGGFSMAKLERNRGMFFGSWTGGDIAEAANVNIGDSTGVTGCTVTPATFGAAVHEISGEYVFIYNGTAWELNGTAVSNLLTSHGLTLTGEAAKNDILVVTYTAEASGWEALGKDNDDLSKELNPDTETSKNVLGETSFTHSGYEPEISIDPYYIDPSRKMYARLRDIALEERYGESDLLGYFAEAYFQTANKATGKMTGYAYVRQAWFVPQSVGGDTAGYAIPVNIYPVGPVVKKKIVYDMATNEATISALA